jgi:hypothetical protein
MAFFSNWHPTKKSLSGKFCGSGMLQKKDFCANIHTTKNYNKKCGV